MSESAVQRTSGRGRFITFEGGEGTGKSTQIKKLADRLKAAKLRIRVTREPGGSPGAEIMRHLVLSGMGKLLGAEAETLLFAAARDDHVRTVIQPALSQGVWVLCDRFAVKSAASKRVSEDEAEVSLIPRLRVGLICVLRRGGWDGCKGGWRRSLSDAPA